MSKPVLGLLAGLAVLAVAGRNRRGSFVKTGWPTFSEKQVCMYLIVSPEQLDRYRRDNRLLAVEVDGEFRYPAWQFKPRGSLYYGMEPVLNRLDLPPAEAALWFESTIDGESPIKLLQSGKVERLLTIAGET
jgi:hypothetical protein